MTVDRDKTAKSAMWSLLENGGLALISMGTLVIYTRLLSTAQFGLFSIVLALVEVLQVFVTMFFHDVLVQRKDVTELHYDTAFTCNMVLSGVLMVGCALGSRFFAAAVHEPNAGLVLCAMTLCFPAAALSATIVARQRRAFAFRPLALRSLLGRILGAAIGIALIVAGAGIWGLIAQQVLILAIGSLFLWWTCRERPRLRWGWLELKQLAGFGSYAMGTLFLGFGIKRVFTVAAGLFLGVEVAGYLNLSFRTVDVFWAIASTAATQVALPLLSSLQTDLPRLKRAFQLAMSLVCFILYSSFIGIGVLSYEVVEVLFGTKWLPSAPYVSALACLVIVQAPRVLVAPLLTALGRPKDLLVGRAAEFAFVLLAVTVTRVPSLGWAVGIWIARELIGLPLNVRQLRSASGFGVLTQFRGALMPLLAAILMAVVVLGTKYSLPASMSALARLLTLVPVGVLAFLLASCLLSRELLTSLLGFMRSALRKSRALAACSLALLGCQTARGADRVDQRLEARTKSPPPVLPPASYAVDPKELLPAPLLGSKELRLNADTTYRLEPTTFEAGHSYRLGVTAQVLGGKPVRIAIKFREPKHQGTFRTYAQSMEAGQGQARAYSLEFTAPAYTALAELVVEAKGSQVLLQAPSLKERAPLALTEPVTSWAASYVPPGYGLVFNDEFSGTALNGKKWFTRYIYSSETLDRLNDENQRYADNGNHRVAGGVLSLVATRAKLSKPSGLNYESGMIRSDFTLRYGFFESRVKMPSGIGTWAAFWINSDVSESGRLGHPPEIDFFEFVNNGKDDKVDKIHCAATRTPDGFEAKFLYKHERFIEAHQDFRAPFDFDDAFHTIGAEWTPNDFTIYVDGLKVVTRTVQWKYKDGELAGPAHVLLNLAIGGQWAGRYGIDDAAFPQALAIDWVRVYQKQP
jgi:O-antigen/teichoic acid export membrane protein/beta-glucanase (GH16 family)